MKIIWVKNKESGIFTIDGAAPIREKPENPEVSIWKRGVQRDKTNGTGERNSLALRS